MKLKNPKLINRMMFEDAENAPIKQQKKALSMIVLLMLAFVLFTLGEVTTWNL